ncbi:hypothetical protein E0L36_23170 [Streptomyces sp. AJS327]|uniref:hypothetical protein n=1 Tax=Streptomyces sp. AJS327 TaxID=2545265 RepID=UPI0015DDE47B|nr:hypothetical protein [Streptomyces sp. AJS327]MBA0053661.1 hypothetical protein [Streptomyces sp. AJS327]
MQSLFALSDAALHSPPTVLAAGVDMIRSVQPAWGPFAKFGTTAKTLLGAVAAVALVISAGTFIVGLAKSKGMVGEGHSTMETSRGKGMMVGGLAGVFLIASLGTIFAITYGLGV